MLLSLLKYYLLYKETGSEQLKVLINEKIDYQISYRAMNNPVTEELLINLKRNIDSIDKVYIQTQLIMAEHDFEFYQLHQKYLNSTPKPKKKLSFGANSFYSTFFKNHFFIFTEKWHNNSIDKKRKAVLNCLFLSLKKEVADAHAKSFNNNIKKSKATVNLRMKKSFFKKNIWRKTK